MRGLPAWIHAPTTSVDVFAAASVRMWEEIANRDSVPWTEGMACAARDWHKHRQALRAALDI
ncbi:MAG: hypothetical protein K0R62_3155 [Nonomuraea muscovyensis]|nr:hypothetical protein [Nonomuraea muscovyensis]